MPNITGTLPFGIEFNGSRQRDIEMRLPTVGDNIRALDEHPDANSVAIELAMMSYSIVRLGDVPQDDINYGLLASMLPNDYDYLADLIAAAKKKLHDATPA